MARVVQSSPWGGEDRALMLAWRTYQDGLCQGCGFPKATSWHHLNRGLRDGSIRLDGEFVCVTCTAGKTPDEGGKVDPTTYPAVVDDTDYDAHPLPGRPEPQIL